MFRYKIISLLFLIIFSSCGGSNNVEIAGDEQSMLLAESMLKALGGKKLWADMKSVHIKTIHYDALRDPFVSEIWANIDENKIITIHADQNKSEFKVVNGNDGWEIKDGQMLILPTNELYPMLRWYRFNFYTNVKRLAIGGDLYELKSVGKKRFNIFEKGEYVGGFELDEENFPLRFFSPGIYRGVKENKIKFAEWDHYGAYPFPKKITGENAITLNETEIFEASSKPAEKAYKITFNPVELAKKY